MPEKKRYFSPEDDIQVAYAKKLGIYDIMKDSKVEKTEKVVKIAKKNDGKVETKTNVGNTIVITERCNRGVLFEGRSSGMGFAMLKRTGDSTFDTVQPISPCKDYLNEVIFTENYDVPTAGCGLKYSKKNNILDKTSFMVITAQTVHKGEGFYYNKLSFKQYSELLEKNYKVAERFLNILEKAIGITGTKITKANDTYYLVELDMEWAKSTFAISLYTLLLRVGIFYDEDKYKDDIMSFLENVGTDTNNIEMFLIKSAIPAIQEILKKSKIPSQSEDTINVVRNNGGSPHGYGILAWKKTYEKVEL